MSTMFETGEHSSNGRKRLPTGFIIGMVLLGGCLIIALGAIGYGFALNGDPFHVVGVLTGEEDESDQVDGFSASEAGAVLSLPTDLPTPSDKPASKTAMQDVSSKTKASSSTDDEDALLPTPLIAQYGDVLIHCPVSTRDVYALLFHQASYPYALVMQTNLPEIDANEVFETHQIDVPQQQPTGSEYMNIGALHVWRTTEYTDMDTAVDVGAPAGSVVFAPVTGTVVLVRTYRLYDEVEDYEVHIQPNGHPDLDAVSIHIRDVCVTAGDKVLGGSTPIARVRDIAGEGVADIHLAQFSDKENGNHTHFQINDTGYEGYKESKLVGAIEVG